MSQSLSHFDDSGASRMVDVSAKDITHREARAVGQVAMEPETLRLILDRKLAKGDVFEVARLAGIMAAKQTAQLIPLCHPLGLDSVDLTMQAVDDRVVRIEATTRILAKTGVEMEALTAVSVAALTIYDMCKEVDKEMVISSVKVLAKKGGKSGDWTVEK